MATRTRTGGGGTKGRAAGGPPGGRSGVRAGGGAQTAAKAFRGAHASQPPKRAKPAPAEASPETPPAKKASAAIPASKSPSRVRRSSPSDSLLALLEELPSDLAADVLRQAGRAVAASGSAKPRLVVNVAPAPDAVSELRRKAFGVMRGRIRVPADFDDTPADLVAAMEGDGTAEQDS